MTIDLDPFPQCRGSPALPSSKTRATASGSSQHGRCPHPRSTTLRTPSGKDRGRRTSRSCSGHANVTGTEIPIMWVRHHPQCQSVTFPIDKATFQ